MNEEINTPTYNSLRKHIGLPEVKENLSEMLFNRDERLLDYVINLQQKIEQYENPDDMTLFYMWLDVKAKDKMKELEEENERLKENNSDMQEEMARVWEENEELRKNQRFHKKFGDDYIFCVEGDKETYQDMIFMYQERIEKAIEYINHVQNYGTMAQVMPHLKRYVNGDDLLNILQNGSDNSD